jgi:HEAT repeat protein
MKHRCLVTIVLLTAFAVGCSSESPEAALEKFYSHDGAEDRLMDPLVLAGDKVLPLVIEKVKDPNMPRRRYAIAFLGNSSSRQALPVLHEILQDKTEKDYFRGDALQSIYLIDESLGLNLARQYQSEDGHVGKVADDLLGEKIYLPERRTIGAALAGKHE